MTRLAVVLVVLVATSLGGCVAAQHAELTLSPDPVALHYAFELDLAREAPDPEAAP